MPHVPSVYFSNYTNVNVHGYSQTMQQYLPNAFVPTDNHQNSIEQVMCFTIVFFNEKKLFIYCFNIPKATHQIQSQQPIHFNRSRGRGRNSRGRSGGTYSRDYQRQINAVQEMNSAQQSAHGMDSQALMTHSANFAPFYVSQQPYFVSSKYISFNSFVKIESLLRGKKYLKVKDKEELLTNLLFCFFLLYFLFN